MMGSSTRRRCFRGAALALLVLAAQAGQAYAEPTGEPPARQPPAADVASCGAAARGLLARVPVIRRINSRIVRLLDAKRNEAAVGALRRAAKRHADAWAGYTLGNLYAAGLGVPRSAAAAFHWYLWAAERGNRFAQREVANAYLNGEGTRRDAAAAAYWFRIGIAPWQLAEMNYFLSETYARGHLAPANRVKSAYYAGKSLAELRALAREPNAQAAYFLGLAYAYGRGVRRDRRAALGYLCRAVALGDARAATVALHLRGQSP